MSDDSPYRIAEQRFDWDAYVRDLGGIRALRSHAAEYLLPCPDCGKVKLAVNTEKRRWRCFVCNDGGKEITALIVKAEKIPWFQAVERVIGGAKRAVGSLASLVVGLQNAPKIPGAFSERPWPDGFRAISTRLVGVPPANAIDRARALSYCAERGIPEYVVDGMRLGVCVEGRFSDRLLFPVFDSGGRLIFYQGRAMWKPRPGAKHIKTLSPKVEHEGQAGAGDVLLNLDALKASGAVPRRIAVVEGPVDCTHAWPDAVASFGKHLSLGQIEQLVKAGVCEVDLCWDSDAVRDAERVAATLADLFVLRVVELPNGKDPGDLSKAEIEYHRGRALPVGNRLGALGASL